MTTAPDQARTPTARHRRRTPFSARAEPRVWLMGSAIVLCLAMILFMVGLIVLRGGATFWPGRIDELRLADGSVVLGVPMGEEPYEPQDQPESDAIEAARAAHAGLADHAWTTDGRPIRRRYFVGNRDLGQETFRWIPLWQIESITRPDDAVLIEREEWGPFLGRLEAVVKDAYLPMPEGEQLEAPTADTDPGRDGRTVRSIVPGQEGRRLRERVYLPTGDASVKDQIARQRAQATDRWGRIDHLNLTVIPRLESKIRQLRWRARASQIEHERATSATRGPTPLWVWMLMLAGAVGAAVGAIRQGRRSSPNTSARRRLVVPACWVAAVLLGSATYLERPGGRADLSSDRLAQIEADVGARVAELRAEQDVALSELATLRAEDGLVRVVAVEPTGGRISPVGRSEPDEPMRLAQVVRVVEANRLGTAGRLGVYVARWWEFLSEPPRDGSAAGGVFPVIVGTVTLTLLLTISVVPLGVIAALYLREYARQGLLTSIIRIAINNLAGVPSIVYGMFGLGFFCYILGGYIDSGPARPMPLGSWWALLGVVGLLVILAGGLGGLSRHTRGAERPRRNRLAGVVAFAGWVGAVGLAGWAIASAPYFHGFFEAKLPEQPTFGGRGILWASLTLALLTLPVVIVATEEAVAAVPGSMREGSFGCGASKWQTIRQIVLPSAMPGIMTGAILAMARGAGEVAPLMLVGAVNLAPTLPVSADPPFLHGDRTFMHLGFHIYTLGFQTPDSEATEPLVWTTTLLLLSIVLLLNLAAIVLRARLRVRMRSAAL